MRAYLTTAMDCYEEIESVITDLHEEVDAWYPFSPNISTGTNSNCLRRTQYWVAISALEEYAQIFKEKFTYGSDFFE